MHEGRYARKKTNSIEHSKICIDHQQSYLNYEITMLNNNDQCKSESSHFLHIFPVLSMTLM